MIAPPTKRDQTKNNSTFKKYDFKKKKQEATVIMKINNNNS